MEFGNDVNAMFGGNSNASGVMSPVLPTPGFSNADGRVTNLIPGLSYNNADGATTTAVVANSAPVSQPTTATKDDDTPATISSMHTKGDCGCGGNKSVGSYIGSNRFGIRMVQIAAGSIIFFGIAYLFFAKSSKGE